MKMPISEILDRYTITKLKSERTTEDVKEELDSYRKEIDKYSDNRVNKYIKKLYDVNGRLWDTEGDIRKGKKLTLEEVGKLALKVRDLNCERNGIKAEVVDEFSEGFKEIKINYKKVNYGRS
jgi:predicted  nucleic acid-binding Zn-ribbon protein